jgi:hypothetical protein
MMRSPLMPHRRPAVAPISLAAIACLLVASLAGGLAGCLAAKAPRKPDSPRPLGLPDDFDLEGDRRSVRQPATGHGAMVDRVTLSLRNRSDRPRVLKVVGVDRLHGTCEALAWDDVSELVLHEPSKPVQIGAAEALEVAVTFDPVECYSVCDRFGFRVHVELDGRPVVVDTLLDVERERD